MPPLRLQILEDVAAHPRTRSFDVRQRIKKPYTTVDRQLQALHILNVLECEEVEISPNKRSWYYSVNGHLNPQAVAPTRFVTTCTENTEEE